MWLSRWLTANDEARETAKAIGAGDRSAVPELGDALPWILGEFQRARRYERTVTVAVLTVTRSSAWWQADARGEEGSTHRRGAAIPAVLAAALRQAMRETDLVAWDPATRRCIVVMPEIGVAEGARAVERMQAVCASGVGCAFSAEVAEFPQDGWTFDELLDVAGERRRQADLREAERAFDQDVRPRARPGGVPVSVSAGE